MSRLAEQTLFTFVGPDLYDINIIITLFLMLFIGGRGSTMEPIVGAGFLIIVPQLINGLERFLNLVFFIVLLLLIVVRPAGLLGAASDDALPLAAMFPALGSLPLLRSHDKPR